MDQLVAGTAAAGGGRSQMADGEGREGRWWPVGGLARTKPAALRATRLHPCVVTLGLASNTPRRRPLSRAGGAAVTRAPLLEEIESSRWQR